MSDKVICKVCGAERKKITVGHVRTHGFKNTQEYLDKYPDAEIFSESSYKLHCTTKYIDIENPVQSDDPDVQFHISKNRTKQRISYAEFLSLLKQNMSLKEMKRRGISKHQVGFYSSLAQNKISITKEQFEEEYKSGKSLDEIAEAYHIQRDHITQLREHYGIKRRGPKYIHRKKTEKPLSTRQKRIIYGGLMGDAGQMSPASIKMKHSTKQKEYLMWKYNELKEHVSPVSLQEDKQYDKRYKKYYYYIRFYTNANSWIEEIVGKFYPIHRKIVTDEILDNIDELALAIWFMDDGTTDWYERARSHIKFSKRNPTCKLCTDDFAFEEIQLICDWFNEIWEIECYPSLRGRKKNGELSYRVKFNVEETKKLFTIIRPYIIPSMLYKVEYNAYKEKEKVAVRRSIMSYA